MIPRSPATAADIAYIVEHLSEQNAAERDAIGWTNEDLIRRLTPMLDKEYSEAVVVNDKPLYVFGVADGFTWFLCTDAAFSLGLRGVLIARKRLAAVREIVGTPLICVSRSPHPDADRWFLALGFEAKPMRSVDGSRMFVYQ